MSGSLSIALAPSERDSMKEAVADTGTKSIITTLLSRWSAVNTRPIILVFALSSPFGLSISPSPVKSHASFSSGKVLDTLSNVERRVLSPILATAPLLRPTFFSKCCTVKPLYATNSNILSFKVIRKIIRYNSNFVENNLVLLDLMSNFASSSKQNAHKDTKKEQKSETKLKRI